MRTHFHSRLKTRIGAEHKIDFHVRAEMHLRPIVAAQGCLQPVAVTPQAGLKPRKAGKAKE